MPVNDHPKSLPGLPYVFPDWLDRLQNRFVSPTVRRYHRFFPTFAVIDHLGRKSGRRYETVVQVYRRGSTVAVLMGHGKTDWVKNILAAGVADVHLFRRDVHVVNPRVVPIGGDTRGLHWMVRLGARRVGIFVADIV